MAENIKVSVLMMAYNHGPFIAEAIEGVLMQKTNFNYELVIGEDKSTDDTLEICLSYQEKYPDKVRVLQRPSNLGMHRNFVDTYHQCRGKYLALCEGDDYFTDPEKLQTQADFLDNHDDFVICFHAAREIGLDGSELITNQDQKEITDITDIVRGWYIRTATYMFRNGIVKEFPEWSYKVKAHDQCFHILLTQDGGKIKFINRVMSVYRRNEGGIMHGAVDDYEAYLRRTIDFYDLMKDNLSKKSLKKIADSKGNDLRESLFYLLRGQPNKSLKAHFEILSLFISLGKIRSLPGAISRKLSKG